MKLNEKGKIQVFHFFFIIIKSDYPLIVYITETRFYECSLTYIRPFKTDIHIYIVIKTKKIVQFFSR